MTRKTAEVAGAGFSGLVAATELARRGFRVRVHEAAPQVRNFGAGIFVWQNGLRVLQHLDAETGLRGRYHEARVIEDRAPDGSLMAQRQFPGPGGGRLATMTRQVLHEAILERAVAAGVEIMRNSTIVSATSDGSLVGSDGEVWSAHLVVGADGIRSKVRDSLFMLRRHEVFTFAVFRFLVPMSAARAHGLTQISNYWDFDGHRRILFVPCDEENLYLLLGADENDLDALSTPIDAQLWRSSFPALASVLKDLPATPRFDRYEALTLRTWHEGRLAIIGDAAHAMPPTFGQGAGTAMMNAVSLAGYASDYDDLEAGLVAWEENERPLTDQTQSGAVGFYERMFTSEHSMNYDWGRAELEIVNYFPPIAEAL